MNRFVCSAGVILVWVAGKLSPILALEQYERDSPFHDDIQTFKMQNQCFCTQVRGLFPLKSNFTKTLERHYEEVLRSDLDSALVSFWPIPLLPDGIDTFSMTSFIPKRPLIF